MPQVVLGDQGTVGGCCLTEGSDFGKSTWWKLSLHHGPSEMFSRKCICNVSRYFHEGAHIKGGIMALHTKRCTIYPAHRKTLKAQAVRRLGYGSNCHDRVSKTCQSWWKCSCQGYSGGQLKFHSKPTHVSLHWQFCLWKMAKPTFDWCSQPFQIKGAICDRLHFACWVTEPAHGLVGRQRPIDSLGRM